MHSPGLVFTRPKVYPLPTFPTFCATKVCLFSMHHSQIIPLSWSCCSHGRPTCHFAAFSPKTSLTCSSRSPLNHGRGLLLQWKILVWPYPKKSQQRHLLYISNSFLLIDIKYLSIKNYLKYKFCKILAVCGQRRLPFRGGAGLGAMFTWSPLAQ